MIATKLETIVLQDGELHLTQLPCQKGDRVEAIVLILQNGADLGDGEEKREEARQRFLAQAATSTFCSSGPYPSRDDLHERY